MLANYLKAATTQNQLKYQFLTGFAQLSASGTFSFTYSNVNLATPAANRYILGIAYSSSSTSASLDIDNATFGGVSATRVISHSGTLLGGFNHAAYFLANVSSGSTATIAWGGTFSGGATSTRQSIALYALYGNPTVVSNNVSASTSTSTTTQSASLASVDVGDLLFALSGNNSNAQTHTYSPSDFGVNYTAPYSSNTRIRTFASGVSTSSGTITTNATFSLTGNQANLSTAAIRL